MALFVNREQKRTQLQEKLAADLKNKLNTANIKADDTDPAFLENAHQTRPAGMVIIILSALVVIGIIVLVISMR